MSEIIDYLKELENQVEIGVLQASSFKSIKYHLAKPSRAGVLDGPPSLLSEFCTQSLDKRTTQAVFSHVAAFWDWKQEHGLAEGQKNPYREFRHKYRRRGVFRANFEPPLLFDFETAKRKILTLENELIRNKALELLHTGMRFTESLTLNKGKIMGKGGKKREVLLPASLKGVKKYQGNYDTFRRHLKRIGLKPHDLRRIFTTHQAKQGKSPYELMRILGLSTILTTQIYVGVFK